MEKSKAIPQGYMTVGEVAKKMGVTVRTLQYYDREGLFSPSAESEGGRRLYTDKDVVKLHQILSLKHLGFSLSDIKNRLIPLDTPNEVAEVLQMQAVDFKKYADIIVNVQMKNNFYWLIKHFDEQTLDHNRSRFDRDSGLAFMDAFTRLQDEALRLLKAGEPPEGQQGQALAKAFWAMVTEFTGGDTSLLPKLMEIGQFKGTDNAWQQKQALVNRYIEPALGAYFSRLGINPFEEGCK